MFRARNWDSFQSYKDRNPPWIRLHKRLIDDINFQKMNADARALLPMIWLLISEDADPVSGMLRLGYEELSFRLRQPEKIIKAAMQEIVKAGFLERINDDNTECYINDTEVLRNCHPETETETETEAETYTEAESDKKQTKKIDNLTLPDWMPLDAWDGFCSMRGKTFTPHAKQLAIKTLDGFRNAGFNPREVLEQSIMNGWKGLFEPKPKGNRNENAGTNYGRYSTPPGKSQQAADAINRALDELDDESNTINALYRHL
jgi:hypothetical protein